MRAALLDELIDIGLTHASDGLLMMFSNREDITEEILVEEVTRSIYRRSEEIKKLYVIKLRLDQTIFDRSEDG